MNLEQSHLREITRRHFFANSGVSLGSLGLAAMLAKEGLAAAPSARDVARLTNPMAPLEGHFQAKAKQVVYLFMAGGPSQLELFTPKPKLNEMSGQVIPESFVAGKRFAFLKKDATLLGSVRKFRQWGESGAVISECLPHLGSIADDVTFIKSMKTEVFNHGPAKLYMNTGFERFSGRPAMGAWVTYGIGSEADSLPGFVVMHSGPRGPRGGTPLWASGFLPTTYQGVPLLNGAEPILNLSNPSGVTDERQGDFVSTVKDLNAERLKLVGDPEIATRIAQYEMAFRMQTSVPELTDLSKEPESTFALYGPDARTPGTYAANCILARRMAERGVRFIQLYHMGWDHHESVPRQLPPQCMDADQPSAALIKDLKQRGLLDSTLIIWNGEFGRTPMRQPGPFLGRDHHPKGFTAWMAGGGIKPGISYGETDEFGYNAVVDRASVHDLNATALRLLGIDHLKLTYRFQGRDFRLTDVHGEVARKMLA